MKTQPFNHSGLRVQAAALAFVGLLLTFLPDWGHQPRAQGVSSVSLSPTSHDYGAVVSGGSKTTTFTVQNGLLADINLDSIQATSPFSAGNGCPGRLAPGASCAIQVSFAPTSSGSYAETLSVTWSQSDLPPPPPGEPPPGGTLTARLTGVGTPPPLAAGADSATTPAGTPVAINVLANDSGGTPPLTVVSVTTPAHGAATTDGRAVTYTPAAGYSGPDSFSYTVRDSAGQTASAPVAVTVTPVAPPALAAGADSATTPAGTPVAIAVLANDSGGTPPLTVVSVTTPAHGAAAISGNAILYTPAAGYSGPDSFSYTVRDSAGQTASAPVTVTVTPVAPPALAAGADSATTPAGTPVAINVLANDSGGKPPLTIVAVTAPAHGAATTDGATVTYTPVAGYSGPDSFSYTVRDSAGQTASAPVAVTVTPVAPPALAAGADSATTPAGTPVAINVLANDSGGVPPLSISAVASPLHGAAAISGNAILYTPAAGYSGPDSFGYTIRDAAGQTASAPVAVTVTPVAPPALAAGADSATTPAGTPVAINVLANDSGGKPPLTIVAVTAPAHGAATTDGATVTYTPVAGYSGPDSFGYTIRDAAGQTASAPVTVTVTPSKKDPQQLLEDAANTPNAAAVGGAIGGLCDNQAGSADFLRDCNALVGAASNNDPAVGGALDQITPDVAGAAPRISQTNVQTQTSNVQSRLIALRSGVTGFDFDRLRIDRGNIQRGGWSLSGQDLRYLLASLGGGGPSAEVDNDLGAIGVFASGTVNLGNRDSTENQVGFDFKTLALTLGADYRFNDQLVLGSAFSYAANDNNIDGNGGYLDTRGYSLTLYGTYYHPDSFYLDGMINYGWNNYDQQRNVVYQLPDADVQQRFSSDYGGQQFFVDLGAGYQFTHGQWTFGPEVRLSYLNLQVDSYQEQAGDSGPGSAWAVAIDEQTLQSLVFRLGGQVNYLIDQSWGVLQPRVELSWLHEFKGNSSIITGQFVEGATIPDNLFYLFSDPVDRNYFELSLGATARFNKGPAVLLQYRTLLGYDNLNLNAITAQLRWEF